MKPAISIPGEGRQRRTVLVIVCLVVLVVFAGCSFPEGESGLPDGETAADRYASMDGLTGTLEISYSGDTDGETRSAVLKVVPRNSSYRMELLEPERKAGNVILLNRSYFLRYNASTDELTRVDTAGVNRTQRASERIRRFVERVNGNAEATAESVGVSTVPVVPGGKATPTGTNLSDIEYTYQGTDTVHGRQTYVVTRRSGNDSQRQLNQTIWIDTETFTTLRVDSVTRVDGERSTYRLRFRNVTFDPDFEADTFTFDPPANAAVDESRSLNQTAYETRSALEADTNVAVPEPELPEGFSFDSARRTVGADTHEIGLAYRRGTERIFVSKQAGSAVNESVDGDPVTVGNRTARYATYGSGGRLSWTCDGYRYTIVGSLAKEQLVAIGETMVCA